MKTAPTLLLLIVFISVTSTNGLVKNKSIYSTPWSGHLDTALLYDLTNTYLAFKGGIEIKSTTQNCMGGFSALSATLSGDTLLCFSDFSSSPALPDSCRSCWYRFQILFGQNNELLGAKYLQSGQVVTMGNTVVRGEIESVARIDSTLYLSFDNQQRMANRIAKLQVPRSFTSLKNWKIDSTYLSVLNYPLKRHNEGIECITETNDGQLFFVHETLPGLQKSSARFAWLLNPTTKSTHPLTYFTRLHEVKGATLLPNGTIVTLEKTFNRTDRSTRICLVKISTIDAKDTSIKGQVIYDFTSKNFDNFEGITSFSRDGKIYILLISDNNGDWNLSAHGSPIQKNIVFLFEVKTEL